MHNHLIFIWALISATIGLILRALSRRSGLLGRIIIGLIGMAWSLLTFFVIPAMIFENVSVVESIKRSGALFRKTWGENVMGQFSIGLIFFVLGLFGLIFPILGLSSGSFTLMLVLFSITVLYWVILGIVSSSLNGIFIAALYNFASKGKIPEGFSEEVIRGAWKPQIGGGFFKPSERFV